MLERGSVDTAFVKNENYQTFEVLIWSDRGCHQMGKPTGAIGERYPAKAPRLQLAIGRQPWSQNLECRHQTLGWYRMILVLAFLFDVFLLQGDNTYCTKRKKKKLDAMGQACDRFSVFRRPGMLHLTSLPGSTHECLFTHELTVDFWCLIKSDLRLDEFGLHLQQSFRRASWA